MLIYSNIDPNFIFGMINVKKGNMKKFILLFLTVPFLFSFTRKDCYELLIKHEVASPTIVLAQAILETNCGKTGVGLSKNNLFGFRTSKGYIHFENYEAAIIYYKKWQDKYYKGQNYYDYLDCLYKSNSGRCIKFNPYDTYMGKLKVIVNQLVKEGYAV